MITGSAGNRVSVVLWIVVGFALIVGAGAWLYSQNRFPGLRTPLITVVLSEDLRNSGGQIWPDKKLARLFETYWHMRFNGRVSEAFRMEAPHFQELVLESYYSSVYRRMALNELVEIVVDEIRPESDYLVSLSILIRFKDATGRLQRVAMTDRWVRVGGKWYHLVRDPFLFRQAA